MPDENQGGWSAAPPPEPRLNDPAADRPDLSAAADPADLAGEAAIRNVPARRGLTAWLLVLVGLGIGGLIFGLQELSVLVALSGLFVVAHAADLDPQWKTLNLLLAWVPPVFGAIGFFALAFAFFLSPIEGSARAVAIGFSLASGTLALLATLPWFANGLVALVFRTAYPSHTLRLATRLSLLCVLLAVPGWFAFRYLLTDLFNDPQPLLEHASLGTGLVGYVTLALASVGFLVRRGWKETFARLGLARLTPTHLGIVFFGLLALTGLNIAADWIQHTLFPDLWESDQRINEALAGNLSFGLILLLGLSAGIGEEITLRGALQPKLGIFLTSLLFAALHVQYSPFGMLVIFALGALLGVIRKHTSTTVAIGVHVLYDVVAVFAVSNAGNT